MASRRQNGLNQHLDIHILGVPMDHGAGRRGVGMGPSAIRIAGLAEKLKQIGHEVTDHGDVLIKDVERASAAQDPAVKGRANNLALIQRACDAVHEHVKRIVKRDGFPLLIGGDHSMAIGTIAGLAAGIREVEAEQRAAGVPPDMVRLSIGIETLDDIVWDLDQALARAAE
jgi:arginase family enzyme